MPVKKKRTYNPRLIRKGHAYYVHEIAALFKVHKNAVLNWVKQGLKTIDDNRPMMIHGSDLADFINARQMHRKRTCHRDEFYCCKCRQPRQAWERVVDLIQLKKGDLLVKAICAECSTNMHRISPARNLPELHELFAIQTINEKHIDKSFNPLVMRDLKVGE